MTSPIKKESRLNSLLIKGQLVKIRAEEKRVKLWTPKNSKRWE